MAFCFIPEIARSGPFTRNQQISESCGAYDRATVLTPDGYKRIDEVRRGDSLKTLASGPNVLEWTGSTVVSQKDVVDMPFLAPIKIKSGALAQGLPTSDLLVTQQQRLFVTSHVALAYFNSYEALVPAVDLLGLPGVSIAQDFSEVTYIRLLFNTQEFIWVNGVVTEVLYSDQARLQDKSPEARRELAVLFPEALDPQYI